MALRISIRQQILSINNLLAYLNKIVSEKNENNCENSKISTIFKKFHSNISPREIKKFLMKFYNDSMCPVDILIIAVHYIEKLIKKNQFLNVNNKLSVLWIVCLLTSKYMLSFDHEIDITLFANLGGYSISEYIEFESILLKNLSWRLEIPNCEYNRLKCISLSQEQEQEQIQV